MSDLNSNLQEDQEKDQDSNDTVHFDPTDPEREPAQDAETNGGNGRSPRSVAARLADWVEIAEVLVITVGIVLFLFSFVFRLCSVSGDSMNDTLYHKEALIVSDLFYTPQSGDIIVFHQTGTLNEPVVKRVIATGGETVSIRHSLTSMTVSVTDAEGNTRVLDEDYCKFEGFSYYTDDYDVTVPEGMLFVLGDNRNRSKDSRHPDIGLVDERRVLGKVLFRVAPLSRFGTVE